MTQSRQTTALISGCSTGIGRSVADQMASRGITVVAGARKPETLAELEARHPGKIHPVAWDLEDEESTRRAVLGTIERFGRLDIIINNAGYGQMGPIIELSRKEWRRQLETNVIGMADTISLATRSPGGMIERRRGRIVNIGSIVGKLTAPFGGAYASSKHAVEALSDAARMELAPFGIQVVLVEPGPVISKFGDNARSSVKAFLKRKDSPYEYLRATVEERASISQQSGIPTESCAAVIVRMATMERPPARMLVTPHARLYLLLKRLLPDKILDAVLRRRFGLTAAPPPAG